MEATVGAPEEPEPQATEVHNAAETRPNATSSFIRLLSQDAKHETLTVVDPQVKERRLATLGYPTPAVRAISARRP
jgi:hypothetical protein